MRNRAYMPQLGRFLQPDPNATALTLIEATSFHGRGMGALVAAFDVQGLYGDGMNLYEYAGSNPWIRADPLGLSWDPFSMVDEYLAEDAGSKAAFLERVIGGARIYAYVGATLLSMLPFPVISNAAALGAAALEGDVPPELALAGKILGYVSLGAISLTISKVAFSASRTALRLYQQHGFRGAVGQVYQNGIGLAKRAHAWVKAKIATLRGKACGCFTAATLVWTATGPVPISEIEIGDKVIAQNEVTGEYSLREVLDTTTAYANLLVVVTVEHGDGRQEAIETTEEHPFYVPSRGWVEAGVLNPGDRLNVVGKTAQKLDEADVGGAGAAPSDVATSSVLSVAFVQHTTTVYNLSVAGINTYLVGPDGVLVHNCGPTVSDTKMGFLLGVSRNSEKAASRAADLARIGLHDSPATRRHLQDHFKEAYGNAVISGVGVRGRSNHGGYELESLLAGPGGFVKAISQWNL
ncbi:MAG: hypothetical protein KF869_15160, partial [Phycisphaeraceae bacterium]|nr:hypothetical protein [Phycisphaeraceae bacterium]